MAKLTRVPAKVFAASAAADEIGQFGSAVAGSKLETSDVATIQALSAWLSGWSEALVSGNRYPALQEMNGLLKVLSYQGAYALQEGIAEYDSTTTYYIGSIVKKTGTFEIYGSLTNDNVGNALTVDTEWKFLGDLSDLINLQNLSTNEPGYVPYSANYGYTSSGYAAYVNKVSNTEVSFLVDDGTSYKPLIVTFPNGKTYCITSISNISGLSTGTITYDFVLEETNLTATGSTLVVAGITYPTYTAIVTSIDTTTYDILEQITEPSASTYNYYLNIATKPLVPYKSNGSSWVETQYIKLGEAVITSSVMATPVSYAFNGEYDSGWITPLPSSSTYIEKNSNLGVVPKIKDLSLKCLVATSSGYAAGQILTACPSTNSNYLGSFALPVAKNTIGFTTGNYSSNGWNFQNKTTGSATDGPDPAQTAYKLTCSRGW